MFASVSAISAFGQTRPLFFRTDYSINSYLDYLTSGLAIGDFNHDGKPDFALGSKYGITVGLGKGDGTFQLLAGFAPVNALSSQLTLAPNPVDVDGDGNVG